MACANCGGDHVFSFANSMEQCIGSKVGSGDGLAQPAEARPLLYILVATKPGVKSTFGPQVTPMVRTAFTRERLNNIAESFKDLGWAIEVYHNGEYTDSNQVTFWRSED